jgi:putative membrane protein
MKKIQSVTLMLSIVFSAFSFSVFLSCSENKMKAGTQSRYSATSHTTTDQDMTAENNNGDYQFIKETAALCISEIKLAQLAQQKSNNTAVIQLACALENVQTIALQELGDLAEHKQITLSDQNDAFTSSTWQDLNARTAADFDRAFTGTLVKAHSEAIMLFEKRIRETTDLDINNWIEKTLPALRHTLEHAELCEKKCV